jgi:hypothetical protein
MITTNILKRVSVYFFKDFISLMSAEAVHFLVYSGIVAIMAQFGMFL